MTLRLVTFSLSFALSLAVMRTPAGLGAGEKIRVACVGASITAGVGTAHPATENYAAQMQARLGPRYDVRNFGVSGCTLLKRGDHPFWDAPACAQALAFNPHLVVVDLGGNDSKAANWAHHAELADDARALIATFRGLPARPRVLLALPLPCFNPPSSGINDTIITQKIIPILRTVAFETGTELIDLHTAFLGKGAWFPDGIHPAAEGAARMAQIVGDTIAFPTDATFDLERNLTALHVAFTVKSFHGYRQLTFPLDDGRACTVVRPVRTAATRPFAWRAEFFGHEPQTDLALLQRGFHVVYVDAKDLFGAPAAMEIWARTHALLTRAGLTGKITLIGLSRGGLYSYHWAALHPETVAAIYGDAPVCDFKSWPLAKGRSQATSATDKAALLKAHKFKDEAEALAYRLNPIDQLAPLAAAHIPILHVVGQADTLVPVEENTDIVEHRYRALGGTIEVIRKPGVDHHPHSLANPEAIVDFILAHNP